MRSWKVILVVGPSMSKLRISKHRLLEGYPYCSLPVHHTLGMIIIGALVLSLPIEYYRTQLRVNFYIKLVHLRNDRLWPTMFLVVLIFSIVLLLQFPDMPHFEVFEAAATLVVGASRVEISLEIPTMEKPARSVVMGGAHC